MRTTTWDGSSPTAFPPVDVLHEILLRVPPQLSFLLRASVVCKLWRAVVADPCFLRRYRARHGGGAPLLGVFHNNPRAGGRFIGAGEPPDRVPAERFSPRDLCCDRWLVLGGGRWLVHGCHRGRAVLHDGAGRLLVWDPVADDSRYVKLPPLRHGSINNHGGLNAVLIVDDDGDGDGQRSCFRFRIAVASVSHGTAVGAVYSSEKAAWGDQATAGAWTSIPSEKPGAAVGDAVYWLLNDNRVLSLKLKNAGGLSVLPTKVPSSYDGNVQLTGTADGKIGLIAVSGCGSALHFLELDETGGDGDMSSSWKLRRTVPLDQALVPAGPEEMDGERRHCTVRIVGVHEDGAVVFLWTVHGVFMLRLDLESESTQTIKRLHGIDETHGQFYAVYPYTSLFSHRKSRECSRWRRRQATLVVALELKGGGKEIPQHGTTEGWRGDELTMTQGSHPTSPAPPLEDENILAEILLRVPPHPIYLSRASCVCNRWRLLIRDPGFLRRFRAFHRTPPVLGFFHNSPCSPRFVSAQGSPGRIVHAAGALRRDGDDGMWWFVECRHGRAILRGRDWADLLVWDPMTAERREIAVPYRVRAGSFDLNAAVLCPSAADADCHSSPFSVVVVCARQGRAYACVYSSGTGSWGELFSIGMRSLQCGLTEEPGALVEDALYWLLDDSSILEFQLGNHRLALVELPSETISIYKRNIRVVRSEGGGLGLTAVKNFSLHMWVREADSEGTVKWVLRREIDLCKLLALPLTQPRVGSIPVWISGIAEDGNVVFLRTMVGIFMVWLETKQFKMLTNSVLIKTVYPYASFYVSEGL